MSGLSKFSLKNGVAVILLCALVLGYGLYSASHIKQQTFPDVEFPAVFVQGVYPGASTEEMETLVTGPVEQSLLGMKGYDSLTSTSAENSSSIFMQFPFGTDMNKVNTDAGAALSKLKLPDQAKVTVRRISVNSQPIYEAAVFSGKTDPNALQAKLEKEVLPNLSKLKGVDSVSLGGTKSEEIRINVDKDKANQRGISLSAIKSAVQSLDYAFPLGSVKQNDTTIPIRLVGKLNALQQIQDLQLSGGAAGGNTSAGAGAGAGADAARGPGPKQAMAAPVKIKLSDIAEVTTVSSQKEITRFNGHESFTISVLKNQDANTADVAKLVKDTLASYQQKDGLDLHVIMDQGTEIEHSVSSLVTEGLYGMLFCIIVIFLFLRNLRATLISILALPISIFATIALLDRMGYTLNIMTLGGIAVSIGRIVDDSIVVIENIYRWRQEKGTAMKGKELAFKATKEVISAVASSTLATVVVFLPLAFVTGIIGEFFRPFAYAVVISIVTSLLVAVMLIPVLGAKFFKKVKHHDKESGFARGFEKLLRGALKRKWLSITVAIVLLIGSLSTIPLLGVSFLPSTTAPTAQINLTLPVKSDIRQTADISAKVEAYVKALPGIADYQVSIGGGEAGPFRISDNHNKSMFSLTFADGTNMEPMLKKMNDEIKPLLSTASPDTTVEVKEGAQNQGPPSGNGIDVTLYSNNMSSLATASKQVENLMKQNSQLKEVTNNLTDVTPKWVLSINQAGLDANVSSFQVMQAVNEQLRPVDIGTYTIDGKDLTLSTTYKQSITSKNELENIDIPTMAGIKKLKDIAELTESSAPVTVNHDSGKTYAKVSAQVKGSNTTNVSRAVQADIRSLALPSGVDVQFGGGLKMITEGFTSIGIAIGAAVGLVFLVMSMTFGGLLTPLIILSSLLFVPVGALAGLLVTGQSLSMSVMIGVLMLVGIVVTNAVVLLDRVEKNRLSGIELTEAIVEAAKIRLRPILMTACATVLALVPLALSQSSSSSLISSGLAITVIGGLTTSTLLTLIVLPVLYQMTGKRRKAREIFD
jgi:multidrug efflux pump subunit AcrB